MPATVRFNFDRHTDKENSARFGGRQKSERGGELKNSPPRLVFEKLVIQT